MTIHSFLIPEKVKNMIYITIVYLITKNTLFSKNLKSQKNKALPVFLPIIVYFSSKCTTLVLRNVIYL